MCLIQTLSSPVRWKKREKKSSSQQWKISITFHLAIIKPHSCSAYQLFPKIQRLGCDSGLYEAFWVSFCCTSGPIMTASELLFLNQTHDFTTAVLVPAKQTPPELKSGIPSCLRDTTQNLSSNRHLWSIISMFPHNSTVIISHDSASWMNFS